MPVYLDPEKREIEALLEFAGGLAGKRVLEIGCGDGRLTWKYASQAAVVTGIDPDEEEIIAARENTPEALKEKVAFFAKDIDTFVSPELFDLAILSWSL